MRRRVFAAGIAACLVGLAMPARAVAAHRARLSVDLQDHLAAGSQAIDVIVHGTRDEVNAVATRYNLTITKFLRVGAVLTVNAGQLAALQGDEAIDHLSGDVKIRASMDEVTSGTIGADRVWEGNDEVPALSGRGVSVAVIDSGIDLEHAALKDRVLTSVDFTGSDGIDRYGHGTHVAGIIAGQHTGSADAHVYQGMAPGAHLVNLRVIGDDGWGRVSGVVDAIDWVIDHRHAFNIRIINLSLGVPVLQPFRDDPMCEAVERAVRAGIVVIASAGNHGKSGGGKIVYGAITSPGNSPYVLTVGALDTRGTADRSDDTLASYSSRGPTRYDLVVKPDVVAPGSRVVSAEAGDSIISRTRAQWHVSGHGENGFIELSGTSMAAAVVSGTAALLLEQREETTPYVLKRTIELTSSFVAGVDLMGIGSGSVNAAAASLLFADRLKDWLPLTAVSDQQIFASRIAEPGFGDSDAALVTSTVSVVDVREAVHTDGSTDASNVVDPEVIDDGEYHYPLARGPTPAPCSSDVDPRLRA